jgi:hypothetical protein
MISVGKEAPFNHSRRNITGNCSCIYSYFFALPFHRRRTDFIDDSSLTFAVNERHCESNASETVLLSAMIYHLIRTHIRMHEFVIDADLVMTNVFSTVLDCIRGLS